MSWYFWQTSWILLKQLFFSPSRLQNSRFFFLKISKGIGKALPRSCSREARAPYFQALSRPFVWLLARTWIRKNTDYFAVYSPPWATDLEPIRARGIVVKYNSSLEFLALLLYSGPVRVKFRQATWPWKAT